jgi:hypothetical protein
MLSAEALSRKYSNLALEDRNSELRKIYAYVPELADPDAGRAKVNALIAQFREDSSLENTVALGKQTIGEAGKKRRVITMESATLHLSSLLGLAHITDTARITLVQDYQWMFGLGLGGGILLEYEDPLTQFYGPKLGFEPRGREGIFSSKEAVEIERGWYKVKYDADQALARIQANPIMFSDEEREKMRSELEELLEEFELTPKSDEEETGLEMVHSDVQMQISMGPTLIERWKAEFIELHGQQP